MERKRALGGQKEKGSRKGVRWKEKERWVVRRRREVERVWGGGRYRALGGQKEKGSGESARWKEKERWVVRRRREVERV